MACVDTWAPIPSGLKKIKESSRRSFGEIAFAAVASFDDAPLTSALHGGYYNKGDYTHKYLSHPGP